jgi:hypothetical protein
VVAAAISVVGLPPVSGKALAVRTPVSAVRGEPSSVPLLVKARRLAFLDEVASLTGIKIEPATVRPMRRANVLVLCSSGASGDGEGADYSKKGGTIDGGFHTQ